jgi:hypothetical protein
MNYKTTIELEVALMRYFDFTQKSIVPNINHGFCIHECDLLVVTNAGYMTEIEIKISRADLKNEKKKKHTHEDFRIKDFYFAVPENLICKETELYMIPDRAGLLFVREDGGVYCVKNPVTSKDAAKLTKDEIFLFNRLGVKRIYTLKKNIIKWRNKAEMYKKELDDLKKRINDL